MTTGTLISAVVLAGSLSLGQAQSINVENKSSYTGNKRWEWTLYATGDTKVINDIRCIEYKLHPTFPNPIQTVCRQGDPAMPFALNGSGWGEFNVEATIKLSGGQTVKLNHWLKLASASRPQICSIGATNTITEREAWTITLLPGMHIYVEEIHEPSIASHLIVINTSRALNEKHVDWPSLRGNLREIKSGTLVSNAYREVSLRPEERASIPLPNKTSLDFFVDYPSRQRTLEIDICK